jgi:Transposase IS200 like
MVGADEPEGAHNVRNRHAHDESSSRGASSCDRRMWFHFWFSTYGTWIRGDERGFRDHDHRIHSSGDYRDPPPHAEHQGLRRWVRQHMHKEPVRLDMTLRRVVCGRLVCLFQEKQIELLVIAVASDHVHGLGRFPETNVRTLIGHAKKYSSHAIRGTIPGAVWARKCALKAIKSRDQQRATFEYIVGHRVEGACVWTFRDSERL